MLAPTCVSCGGALNQLTIFEYGSVKHYACWCVNPECSEFGLRSHDRAPRDAIERRGGEGPGAEVQTEMLS